MGAAEIIALAASLLGSAGEVATLAAQAIEASRAGDDQRALELLDQALAQHQAAVIRITLQVHALVYLSSALP